MGLQFRRQFRLGPLRLTVSQGGVGLSVGRGGIRVGRTARGALVLSVGVPGTGLYYRKTLRRAK